MPIYEYNCPHCESSFEELVRSQREVVRCPRCESDKVERQFSVFSAPGGRAVKGGGGGGGCGCTPQTCGCH